MKQNLINNVDHCNCATFTVCEEVRNFNLLELEAKPLTLSDRI